LVKEWCPDDVVVGAKDAEIDAKSAGGDTGTAVKLDINCPSALMVRESSR